ncbi:hypothetical protein BT69DRAFT_1032109 [Atractiella rhizophila]|nr:hypothetical protein BT69DRAFT_1032109 [Atractiella rhizophila]
MDPLQITHDQTSGTVASSSVAALSTQAKKRESRPVFPPAKLAPMLVSSASDKRHATDDLNCSEREEEGDDDEWQAALQKEWDEHNKDKESCLHSHVTRSSALTAIFDPSKVDEDLRAKAILYREEIKRLCAASNITTALGVKGTASKSGAEDDGGVDEEEKQQSPTTTRRNMLAEEFREGLCRNLIRESQVRRRNGGYDPWDWATAIKDSICGNPNSAL